MSKSNPDNQSDFSINELLYDICVIKTATIASAKGHKHLPYVTEVIWQVESEFQADDSRETLKDFNKLILGSAEYKLFIAPPGGTLETWILSELCVPATHCLGQVFLALVPHPKDWNPHGLQVQLFKLQNERWAAVATTYGR